MKNEDVYVVMLIVIATALIVVARELWDISNALAHLAGLP